MNNIRTTNIRFNMDDEKHRQAWQLLQDRDKKEYPSYSQAVVDSLICLLAEKQSEGIDWSDIENHLEDLISNIVENAVNSSVERMIPFLAGYMACAGNLGQTRMESSQPLIFSGDDSKADEPEETLDEDIDFDFLGLN